MFSFYVRGYVLSCSLSVGGYVWYCSALFVSTHAFKTVCSMPTAIHTSANRDNMYEHNQDVHAGIPMSNGEQRNTSHYDHTRGRVLMVTSC